MLARRPVTSSLGSSRPLPDGSGEDGPDDRQHEARRDGRGSPAPCRRDTLPCTWRRGVPRRRSRFPSCPCWPDALDAALAGGLGLRPWLASSRRPLAAAPSRRRWSVLLTLVGAGWRHPAVPAPPRHARPGPRGARICTPGGRPARAASRAGRGRYAGRPPRPRWPQHASAGPAPAATSSATTST